MLKCTITHEGNVAVISLSGGITSNNSVELEAALGKEPEQASELTIDASALDYISSAGLRVLLSAKKRCGKKPFRVINVNDEVMNIFEVTGFSEIMDISRAKRKISIENCTKIGSGACGEVYRLNDETIIKLYYSKIGKEEIEQEKALSRKAFVLGVPTAISYDIVEADGRTGVVYELLRSKTLGELMRENESELESYVKMYATICRDVHSIEVKSGELPSFKEINREDIKNVTGITEEERAILHQFLDLVPESLHCVHGDLNINNIMVQNGECCLIDMGEFSTGLPMFDLSRIVFSMEYAADGDDEFNSFYKMPQATVKRILDLLLKDYFGTETLEEAESQDPLVKWLYPLAWFRCCTSLLKGNRWPEKKRQLALSLLREKLIPFFYEQSREN